MKHLTPFWTVMISIMLMTVAANLLLAVIDVEELFGAQGGELVQLRTSHVPTMSDIKDLKKKQEQVKKEIINMTGYL
jgi:hypothetical protein